MLGCAEILLVRARMNVYVGWDGRASTYLYVLYIIPRAQCVSTSFVSSPRHDKDNIIWNVTMQLTS